jgi:hypothetical protein
MAVAAGNPRARLRKMARSYRNNEAIQSGPMYSFWNPLGMRKTLGSGRLPAWMSSRSTSTRIFVGSVAVAPTRSK